MSMIPIAPEFFVVYAFCPVEEDFVIAAILTEEAAATRCAGELEANKTKSVCVMKMTMDQIKSTLVKARLGAVGKAIEHFADKVGVVLSI